jgi:hypothetical protein
MSDMVSTRKAGLATLLTVLGSLGAVDALAQAPGTITYGPASVAVPVLPAWTLIATLLLIAGLAFLYLRRHPGKIATVLAVLATGAAVYASLGSRDLAAIPALGLLEDAGGGEVALSAGPQCFKNLTDIPLSITAITLGTGVTRSDGGGPALDCTSYDVEGDAGKCEVGSNLAVGFACSIGLNVPPT